MTAFVIAPMRGHTDGHATRRSQQAAATDKKAVMTRRTRALCPSACLPVRALGVTSAKRSHRMSDVPTIAE
jgi:hypothetical protein